MKRETLYVKRKTWARNCCLFTVAFLLCLSGGQTLAFKILEPAERTVLQSGQTVTATIDLGNDPGVVQVRYYWYGELDDTLVQEEQTTSSGSIVAPAVLVSTALNDPPFGGPLKVPREAIGTMRLLAVGDISRGRLGGRSTFDEILLTVEPKAELTAIEFETEKPWRLGRDRQDAGYGQVDTLGKIIELPMVGLFSDGVTRSLRSSLTGTSFQSSNERVIKVHRREGLLQVVGNGRTTITATNRGKQATLEAGRISPGIEELHDRHHLILERRPSTCELGRTADGRLRLIEHFRWESREGSGTNVFEELEGQAEA